MNILGQRLGQATHMLTKPLNHWETLNTVATSISSRKFRVPEVIKRRLSQFEVIPYENARKSVVGSVREELSGAGVHAYARHLQ